MYYHSTNLDRRPTDNAGPVGTKAEAVAAVASAITHEAFMFIGGCRVALAS